MKDLICIMCPKGCHLKVDEEHGYTVTGNRCPRGAEYGHNELKNPTRVITSTVRLPLTGASGPREYAYSSTVLPPAGKDGRPDPQVYDEGGHAASG